MIADTLAIARDLKASKMPAAQAEAVATAIGYTVHENVATKADLHELELRFDAKMDAKLERLRANLIMWMVSSQIALAAILLAALKL